MRLSVRLCAAFALALLVAACVLGPWFVCKYWLLPYLVFCGWLDLVTYLHHTNAALPWYRGSEWSWLRGALSTVDRRYGIFEKIHHDAGCHVVHHLFPTIPHYRLREAAAAVRPLLGAHYRAAETGIWRALRDALPKLPGGARRGRRRLLRAARSHAVRYRGGVAERRRIETHHDVIRLRPVLRQEQRRAAQEEQEGAHGLLAEALRQLLAVRLQAVAPVARRELVAPRVVAHARAR